jgi:hypothetical protein
VSFCELQVLEPIIFERFLSSWFGFRLFGSVPNCLVRFPTVFSVPNCLVRFSTVWFDS